MSCANERAMRRGVGHEHQAAVERQVQPLVPVGRPGVGELGARQQMAMPLRSPPPTGRTRHRHAPRPWPRARARQAGSKGSNTPVLRSPACRQTTVGAPSPSRSACSSARISIRPDCRPARRRWRRCRRRAAAPSAGSIRGGSRVVRMRSGGAPDRPLASTSQPRSRSSLWRAGGERRGVRHLAAGDEGERGRLRQAEHLLGPFAAHLLDHRLGRRGDVGGGVLVPGRGQPVGRQRDRQRAADHPAEEAAAARAHQAALGVAHQLVDDGLVGEAGLGQRFAEPVLQLADGRRRGDRPRRQGLEEGGGMRRRAIEDVGHGQSYAPDGRSCCYGRHRIVRYCQVSC